MLFRSTCPESTIPEHPHRGFEIISVVLEGALEHYDSLNRQWVPLDAGGVQVIQSGSGLSHSERLSANARMFQIWLDPNLAETFGEPPAYADYAPGAFAPSSSARELTRLRTVPHRPNPASEAKLSSRT